MYAESDRDYASRKSDASLTVEQIMARADDSFRREEESFQRCDTDGSVSQWCHTLSGNVDRQRAKIRANGDRASFIGLYTVTGERVPAMLVHSKFAYRIVTSWKLRDDAAAKYGRRFIPSNNYKKPGRIQKALGLIELSEKAPAWARIGNSNPDARGFSGLSTCFTETYRIGDQWGMDAIREDEI